MGIKIGQLVVVGLVAALCLWVGIAPWIVVLVATFGLAVLAVTRRLAAAPPWASDDDAAYTDDDWEEAGPR
jgi:hypothetical protein